MCTPSKGKKSKGIKVRAKKKVRWDGGASDSEKRDADASSDEDNESRGSPNEGGDGGEWAARM